MNVHLWSLSKFIGFAFLIIFFQGTKSVRGIFFNLSEIKNSFSISEKSFKTMKKLRFLIIYGVIPDDIEVILALQGGEEDMWCHLRFLEWWGFSMRCMPSNFSPENLVELIMPNSHLETLWDGAQVSYSCLIVCHLEACLLFDIF